LKFTQLKQALEISSSPTWKQLKISSTHIRNFTQLKTASQDIKYTHCSPT